MAQIQANHEPGERFVVLRILSTICIGVATILLIAAVLVLMLGLYSYMLANQGGSPANGAAPSTARQLNIVPFVNVFSPIVFLWTTGAGLQMLAVGYLIRLALQVEENTRTSARCLEKLTSHAEPSATPSGPRFIS